MCLQCVGMCSYCDCRTLPVVSRLSEEHREIVRLTGEIRAAASSGASTEALFDELIANCLRHHGYEERSLYRELHRDETFAEVAGDLCEEHEEIGEALRRARDTQDPDVVRSALDLLDRHIVKEERGLFPPAVILLDSTAWERAAAST